MKRSLSVLFALATLIILTFALGISTLVSINLEEKNLRKNMYDKISFLALSIPIEVELALWSLDDESCRSIVEALMLDDSIVSIEILDQKGGLFVGFDRDGKGLPRRLQAPIKELAPSSGKSLSGSGSVIHQGAPIGSVQIRLSDSLARRDLADRQRLSLLVTSLILALGSLGTFLAFRKLVSARIKRLDEAMERFNKDDFGARAALSGSDELSRVGKGFNTMAETIEGYRSGMEELVAERTSQLLASQKEFEASRLFMDAILETLRSAIYVKDLEGRYIYVNGEWERVTGFARGQAIGKSSIDINHQGLGKEYHESDLRLIEIGRTQIEEEFAEQEDGTKKYYLSKKIPLVQYGRITGLCCIATEITERKRIEEALNARVEEMGRTRRAMLNIMDDLGEKTRELAKENEERLRSEARSRESEAFLKAFIDNSTAIIFAKDVDGRYILGNAAWVRIVGIPPAEAMGKTDYELFPKDLAESYRLNDLEVQNHSRVLENEEIVVVDGERRTFISAKFPIPGLDGRPKATCGMLTDITERKNVEKAIRENEKQLRTIFEGSPLGMIHMNDEGTIIDCNEKFVELMGSSRAKLIGFNSVRQGKDAVMIAALSKALAGETAEYESYYTSATGGKTTPIHMKFNPVNVGQDPTEVIVTLDDISERKKVEQELKEHLEELEKFNRLTINREEKMIELKAEINILLEKAGETAKYKIVV